MDEAMKAWVLTVALLAGAAWGQAVPDPTRPPAQMLRPTANAQANAKPQLQSILVGRAPGGRRVAVIDGNTVRIGDVVGGARVVGITQAQVVLRRGARQEILTLSGAGAAPDRKPE
jgi:MSHA biogenesis protein MshK